MFTIARKQLKKLKSGSVLSLVVLMSLVLSIVGISLMTLSAHARTRAVRTADELCARVAADAGLIRAISMMNKKLEQETVWDTTDLPSIDEATLPGMNASYSFFIEDGDSGYRVISTGQTLMNTKTVYADLRLGGLYDYAVFGSEKIELKQGTSIDAYNFGEDNPFLRIGTNSTNYNAIDLKNGTTVNGDVVIGPGGDADIVIQSKLSADITGQIYPLPYEWSMPIVSIPQNLVEAESSGSPTSSLILSSDAKYDQITLNGSGKTIEIDGNVTLYIIGDVELSNSAQIIISETNPDAELTLYLGGDFRVRNSGLLNNLKQDPASLSIYGLENCTNIDFHTDCVFYGTIYAPNADVDLKNRVDISGSVIAKSIVQHANADFNYDNSLRNVDIDDIGVHFLTTNWHEE